MLNFLDVPETAHEPSAPICFVPGCLVAPLPGCLRPFPDQNVGILENVDHPRFQPENADPGVKVSNENKKLGPLAIALVQPLFYRALGGLGLSEDGRYPSDHARRGASRYGDGRRADGGTPSGTTRRGYASSAGSIGGRFRW